MDALPGPIAQAIIGTPLEGNEVETRRLGKFHPYDQVQIVSVIAGGEAKTVNGAVESIRAGLGHQDG